MPGTVQKLAWDEQASGEVVGCVFCLRRPAESVCCLVQVVDGVIEDVFELVCQCGAPPLKGVDAVKQDDPPPRFRIPRAGAVHDGGVIESAGVDDADVRYAGDHRIRDGAIGDAVQFQQFGGLPFSDLQCLIEGDVVTGWDARPQQRKHAQMMNGLCD
ncbi:Uncharacterised protein [Mycobacteroides abscessus subsp. abscessus]|nr:Uncharacterised protein [Mycobacteroides abscessus subsp. abscessus]